VRVPDLVDREITLQGHYAGGVTRLAAFAIDIGTTWLVYVVTLAALGYGIGLVTGASVNWNDYPVIWTVGLVGWAFVYFAYPWALSGRTLGMAVLGLRVVRRSGAWLDPRHAVIRTLALPLSFLLFGLGLIGIVIGRERRALHDVIADTTVVYAWDARAARLRFMARSAEAPIPPYPGRPLPVPAGPDDGAAVDDAVRPGRSG